MPRMKLLNLKCDHQVNDGGDSIRLLRIDEQGEGSRVWGRATPLFRTGDPSTRLPDWVSVASGTVLELKEMIGGRSLGRQMIPDERHARLEGGTRLARFSAQAGAHYSLSYESVADARAPAATQGGRAERPLNRAAVREANQRFWEANPELDDRQLDRTPPDYPYRREWMQYYRESLAEQNAGSTSGGGAVSDPSQPCSGATGPDPDRQGSEEEETATPVRVYFAIYYHDQHHAFRRAAYTWRHSLQSRPSHRDNDIVIVQEIFTEGDFKAAWRAVRTEAEANNAAVAEGRLFTHASYGDRRDGLEFRSDDNEDGTLTRADIEALPVLPWAERGAELIIHSCNSGVTRDRSWAPAQVFAQRQRVTTVGQTGWAYFSERRSEYRAIDALANARPPVRSSAVYLWAYERMANIWLGSTPIGEHVGTGPPGGRLPGGMPESEEEAEPPAGVRMPGHVFRRPRP